MITRDGDLVARFFGGEHRCVEFRRSAKGCAGSNLEIFLQILILNVGVVGTRQLNRGPARRQGEGDAHGGRWLCARGQRRNGRCRCIGLRMNGRIRSERGSLQAGPESHRRDNKMEINLHGFEQVYLPRSQAGGDS